jgi:hypothetical protein
MSSEKEMRPLAKVKMWLGRKKKFLEEIIEMKFRYSTFQGHLSLKDKYIGQRCFVVGNGPSLNQLDLTYLNNEFVFGANSLFLKKDVSIDALVVEDRLVFEDNLERLSEYNESTKFFPLDLKRKDKHLNFLNTHWLPFRRVHYSDRGFVSKEDGVFYWGGTVTYLSLQLAYYMGFKEIYLIGMDMSYSIPSDAKIEGAVITSQSADPNHFDSTYFGKGKRWHLPDTERMQRNLDKARIVLEKEEIQIFNATIGGNLKGFERIEFNKLFNCSE